MNSAHPICLQEVCITCTILVYIYSMGTFPITLSGGMSSHTCSPCADRPPYYSWYEQILAQFDFSIDIIPTTLCTESMYHH